MEKIRELIQKILRRREGQALKYRIIFSACAFIHLCFIFIFSEIGISEMVYFNIVSVIFYIAGIIFSKSATRNPAWFILMYFEIVLHAIVSNFALDWSYGFSLYSLMVIPISYYLAYMHPKIRNPNILTTALAVINIITMVLAGAFSNAVISNRNAVLSKVISSFNFVVCTIVITTFAAIFIYEINSTLKDLNAKNDELNFLAAYDPLTKLRNRHRITDIFSDYEKGTEPFCVILGDIDDFKRINDTYSHDCGDKVLVTISEIIRKNVGDNGTACRWGGEEILLIIKGKNEECLEIAERIRLEIQSRRMSFAGKQINVTMTFGFTDYSEATSIEKLISMADKRLYKGKKNGKNQVISK